MNKAKPEDRREPHNQPTKESDMTQAERIAALMQQTKDTAVSHGLMVRCPDCNAGIGKWCIGTDHKASHKSRLRAAGR